MPVEPAARSTDRQDRMEQALIALIRHGIENAERGYFGLADGGGGYVERGGLGAVSPQGAIEMRNGYGDPWQQMVEPDWDRPVGSPYGNKAYSGESGMGLDDVMIRLMGNIISQGGSGRDAPLSDKRLAPFLQAYNNSGPFSEQYRERSGRSDIPVYEDERIPKNSAQGVGPMQTSVGPTRVANTRARPWGALEQSSVGHLFSADEQQRREALNQRLLDFMRKGINR